MKNAIRFFLISFLGCMLSFPLFGQEASSDAEKEWTQLGQLGIINDDGTITPLGNNHQERLQMQARERRIIDQTNGSQIAIEQKGKGNTTEWFHNGYDNSIDIEQHGSENTHKGVLVGQENFIRVEQRGNSNTVLQDLTGDNMDIEVIQRGNNHELIQVEPNGTSPAYQIHQQGNHGMKVKIEHERY